MADKFTSSTVLALKLRAGTICSNPNCLCPTTGPHTDSSKAVTVGEAAHITAASEGGPRYDASLSSEERKSASNGVWLCSKCADLVDKDPANYSVALLHSWKTSRENQALVQINGCPLPSSSDSSLIGIHSVIPIPEQYRQRIKELIDVNDSNEATLTLQAVEHSNHGRLDDAIDIFTSIAYSSHNCDHLRMCWAFFFRLAELDLSLFLANRLVAIADTSEQHCNAEHVRAMTLLDMGRPTQAKDSFDSALKFANQASRDDLASQQFTGLGLLYMMLGDETAAEKHFQKSLKMCDEIHFAEGAALNYSFLGQLFMQTDRTKDAMEMHQKALVICERENDHKGQALQLCNLGLLVSRNDDDESAERYHRRALEIDEKIGWKKGISTHSHNVGILLLKRGEEDEAEPYLTTSAKISKELGDYHLAYRAYHSTDAIPLF